MLPSDESVIFYLSWKTNEIKQKYKYKLSDYFENSFVQINHYYTVLYMYIVIFHKHYIIHVCT